MLIKNIKEEYMNYQEKEVIRQLAQAPLAMPQ